MKKLRVCLLLAAFVMGMALPARAESSLKVVFEDALWGAAIGTLVGAGTLAFMDTPSDHYERLAQGAAIGLVLGVGFGVYEIAPVFYTLRAPGSQERIYGLNLVVPLK